MDAAVVRWYALELLPRLASLRTAEIAGALSVSVPYSLQIKHGRVPHPRNFAPLAKLAGATLPKALLLDDFACRGETSDDGELTVRGGEQELERPGEHGVALDREDAEPVWKKRCRLHSMAPARLGGAGLR